MEEEKKMMIKAMGSGKFAILSTSLTTYNGTKDYRRKWREV